MKGGGEGSGTRARQNTGQRRRACSSTSSATALLCTIMLAPPSSAEETANVTGNMMAWFGRGVPAASARLWLRWIESATNAARNEQMSHVHQSGIVQNCGALTFTYRRLGRRAGEADWGGHRRSGCGASAAGWAAALCACAQGGWSAAAHQPRPAFDSPRPALHSSLERARTPSSSRRVKQRVSVEPKTTQRTVPTMVSATPHTMRTVGSFLFTYLLYTTCARVCTGRGGARKPRRGGESSTERCGGAESGAESGAEMKGRRRAKPNTVRKMEAQRPLRASVRSRRTGSPRSGRGCWRWQT